MEKAFILVSIKSKVVSIKYFNYLIKEQLRNFKSIDFILLDKLETYNLRSRNTLPEETITNEINVIKGEIINDLHALNVENILDWDSFIKDHDISLYSNALFNEFNNNNSFRNHCLNQTFKNLQPILIKRGIYNKNSPELVEMAKYIINEVALKLYVYNTKIYDVEIAPHDEMDIFKAIISGKYENLRELIKHREEYFRKIILPLDYYSITLKDINFNYNSKTNFSLKNIDLFVPTGSRYGILGRNGSGKTTLLKIIGGHFSTNNGGGIFLGDTEITKLSADKRPISTVFQDYALFPHLNVAENIAFGLQYGKKYKKDLALGLAKLYLQEFDLSNIEHEKPDKLSGGQKQKVALIRALAVKPTVLLLDEPTSSLDYEAKNELISILNSLYLSYTSIIVVSHDKDFLLSVCDKICIIDNGKKIAEENVQKLFNDPTHPKIVKELQLGSIISGFLNENMIFKDDNGELSIKFDSTYKCLRYTSCYLLIRPNQVNIIDKVDNEINQGDIILKSRIDEIYFKNSFHRIALVTKGLNTIYIDISNRDYKKSYIKGKQVTIAINSRDLILIKKEYDE